VACTGVHGANRLASNSLLEGAVFSQRVAERMAHLPPRKKEPDQTPAVGLYTNRAQMEQWKERIRTIMWEKAGIIRTAKGLIEGLNALRELESEVPVSAWECRNMITVSQAILQSALWRQESRGGHYRADFPETLEEWAKKHRVV
jgi:L-aspartate oxidase